MVQAANALDGRPAAVLTVACVEVGDYCGRGVEYVRKLRAGVERHLSAPHVFRLFTDGLQRHWPTLQAHGIEIVELPARRQGWWAKVALFRPDAFVEGDRVLYLDLDTIVVGPLEPLAAAKGILHLGRWGWKQNDYGSGVMVWDHGEHAEIYSEFNPRVPRQYRGDQDWMTKLGGWPALPDALCRSYRYHAKAGPPEGASVVCFHGTPRPHEVREGWVPQAWA